MNRTFGFAVAVAGLVGAGVVGAQERPALYGALELSGDFSPDPVVVEMEAGGDMDASVVDGRCTGMVNSEGPDITVDFSEPTMPLNIYVLSEEDTTLLVRRPNGSWECNDDADGTNPWVRLAKPASGQYAIWVGVVGSGFVPATVLISQADPDWYYSGASAQEDTFGDTPPMAERERPEIPFDVEPGSRAETIAQATVAAIQSLLGSEPESLILHVSSPVTAADDGQAVEVVFPGVRLEDAYGTQFLPGDVTVVVTPRDGEVYDFATNPPTRIQVVQNDSTVGFIDYGGASLTGSWSAGLQALLSLDGSMSDVAVRDYTSGIEELKLRILTVNLQHALSPGGDGLWHGPYRFALQGIELREGEGNSASLGSLAVEGSVEAMDLAGWAAISSEYGANPFLAPMDGATEDAFTQAVSNLSLGRSDGRLSLADLLVTEGGVEAFRLGEFALNWQMDAREAVGDVAVGLTAGGFAVGMPDVPAELRPTHIAVDLLLQQLPVKTLFATAVPAPGMDGDPAELLGVLFQGEPSLSLTGMALRTEGLDLAAKGDLAMTPDGPQGAFSILVEGLAKTIEAMQQSGLPGVEEALPLLVGLRDLPGAATATAGMVEQHRFEVDIGAQGLTINGRPMEELFQ